MSTETLAPLHERRPEWVEARIKETYAAADGRLKWPESGWHEYGFPPCVGSVLGLVEELAATHPDPRLNILDIGCGGGLIIAGAIAMHHEAQGITAADYRISDPPDWLQALSSEQYIVGDAQRLPHLPGLLPSFHLVTSRFTWQYMADPLAPFEAALDRVVVGGTVAVDGPLPPYAGSGMSRPYDAEAAQNDLARAGFEVHPIAYSGTKIDLRLTTLLHRVHADEPLRLRAQYEKQAGGRTVAYARLEA